MSRTPNTRLLIAWNGAATLKPQTDGSGRVRILVVGATGGLGQDIVAESLVRGHETAALVRTPARATFPEAVGIVQGDVLDLSSLTPAVVGRDAVICALGTPSPRRRSTLLEQGTKNLIAAMSQAGVPRLAFVTLAGRWLQSRERFVVLPGGDPAGAGPNARGQGGAGAGGARERPRMGAGPTSAARRTQARRQHRSDPRGKARTPGPRRPSRPRAVSSGLRHVRELRARSGGGGIGINRDDGISVQQERIR